MLDSPRAVSLSLRQEKAAQAAAAPSELASSENVACQIVVANVAGSMAVSRRSRAGARLKRVRQGARPVEVLQSPDGRLRTACLIPAA